MNNKIDNLINFVNENNKNNEIVRSKKKSIKLFIINILTIVLLISSGMGMKAYLDQKKDADEVIEVNKKLKKQVIINNTDNSTDIDTDIDDNKQEETTKKEDYSALVKQNSDMVGWLKVFGTEIDMPVVKSTNNEFYLTHDFNKKWNSMGWAFTDYRNTFPDLNSNTIIYGHTYKRTTIFSTLKDVLEEEWLNDNSLHYIIFNTLEEDSVWEIFSVYTIKETSDYLITDTNDEFINMIKNRSIKNFEKDVDGSNKIITLSTCYKNSNTRLVVHAKKVS